jgi:phytoene desaturase
VKKIIVIGSGFAGIAAASYMAKEGWDVTVLEKHEMAGGRARKLEAAGFKFDMGPSWYWMPGVFEQYFNNFGKKRDDYYQLKRLDPSYRVYWPGEAMNIPADYEQLKSLFESIEQGSAKSLDKFLQEAAYKYEVGINKLVQKPGRSLTEFLDADLVKGILKLDVFTSMKKHVGKYFSDPRLRQLMEFPVLFLGALPQKIPALYSLMNYADIKLGTWYPGGGMYEVIKAMQQLAEELGVKFIFNKEVEEIVVEQGFAKKLIIKKDKPDAEWEEYAADVIIGAADYHFIENKLLPAQSRSYNKSYWDNRVMAPSCLIYYIGVNKKLKNIQHHNLFFDTDFEQHGKEIYETKEWPRDPLFYVCASSVTDSTVAPENSENLFLLVPVAAGLEGDTEELKDRYFEKLLDRFEKQTGELIRNSIVFKRSYSASDFVHDYNAFKGNAYGLANTLMQTAILKPSLKSRKVKNLYYTGQLTVPGPGVPPSLISGEVVAREIVKNYKKNN